VNVAVRLEPLPRRGVAVSDKAYQEAGKHLGIALADGGSHRFKNIEEPVRSGPGAGRRRFGGRKPDHASETTSGIASNLPPQYRTAIVGVLPFANLTDQRDEYFPTD